MKVFFTGSNNFHFLEDIIDFFKEKKFVTDEESGADIIWIEWATPDAIPIIERNIHKKLVIRCHAYELNNPKNIKKIPWHGVDLAIFVSPYKRALFHTIIEESLVKSIVIPNAVNISKYPLMKDGECSFWLGMLGRIYPNKNILPIVKLLRKMDDRWKLYIQGPVSKKDNFYFYRLKLMSKILGLDERVFFHPVHDDPLDFYSRIDIIVSNSVEESFHAVIAEGMLCGCFSVISNWDGAHYFYPDDKIYSNYEDFLHMVKKYQVMDNLERRQISEMNRNYICDRYSIEVVGQQIIDSLSALCS